MIKAWQLTDRQSRAQLSGTPRTGQINLRIRAWQGSRAYLQGAEKIANTLSANIQPDGHIPFRVFADTGVIKEDYTSSQVYAIRLFESLGDLLATSRYSAAKDRVWGWLVQNPVSNMVWNGFYEDVAKRPDNRTN